MRRVVTGTDAAGRSVVVSDKPLAGDTTERHLGARRFTVWGDDGAPVLPIYRAEPTFEGYWPQVGGFRYSVGDILPDGLARPVRADDSASSDAVRAVMEDDGSGFHSTETVDVVFVVSGEPTLELDDGILVDLHPGDIVVQNGTRHAWRNRSDRLCRIAVAVFGATRGAASTG
jgi:mannose-6-phosphate isomerase-like protein (cupin superfamily)